ncbi:hypothetical protein O181_016773 [Austropuccinia psidii MF-1]|uniref:Uncharacterized protein n=1 Tax=Austropuccinia psidii MF-1 TaxID=1389203 RepID=A0A9Q3C5V3_9BASI|nr:hypothetical protein [Austropuccinia psidii MF-1]
MTNNIQPSEDVQPPPLHVGMIPQSSSQEEEVIYSTNVEQVCSTTHVPNPINLHHPISETSNRLHINNQNIKHKRESPRNGQQGHTEGHQYLTPRRRQDRRVAKIQRSYPHQQDPLNPQSFSRANLNTDPISDNNNSVPLHTTTYTEYHDLENVNVLSDHDLDGSCIPEDSNLDFTNLDSGQDLDGPNLNPDPALNRTKITSYNLQRKQPNSTLLLPPPSASTEPSDFL